MSTDINRPLGRGDAQRAHIVALTVADFLLRSNGTQKLFTMWEKRTGLGNTLLRMRKVECVSRMLMDAEVVAELDKARVAMRDGYFLNWGFIDQEADNFLNQLDLPYWWLTNVIKNAFCLWLGLNNMERKTLTVEIVPIPHPVISPVSLDLRPLESESPEAWGFSLQPWHILSKLSAHQTE